MGKVKKKVAISKKEDCLLYTSTINFELLFDCIQQRLFGRVVLCAKLVGAFKHEMFEICLLYTSPIHSLLFPIYHLRFIVSFLTINRLSPISHFLRTSSLSAHYN